LGDTLLRLLVLVPRLHLQPQAWIAENRKRGSVLREYDGSGIDILVGSLAINE
jgi:hypothetical protein